MPTLEDGEPCAIEPAPDPASACVMPAGDYHARHFGTGVAFTLFGDDWRDAASEPDVVALFNQSRQFFTFVSGKIVVLGPAPAEAGDAAQAKAALAQNKALSVKSVSQTRKIGGITAAVFDVANIVDTEQTLFDYPAGSGRYYLSRETSIRVYWLTVRGAPMLVILEADTADLADYISIMKPSLDSIVFD